MKIRSLCGKLTGTLVSLLKLPFTLSKFVITNPTKAILGLLYGQSQAVNALTKTKVSYFTYPIAVDSPYTLVGYMDGHVETALLHCVHAGLVFNFPNGTYRELHYGQNVNDSRDLVIEYVDSHYPNQWRGWCDPTVIYPNDQPQFDIQLNNWQAQHKVGDMLFIYSPAEKKWQGHIITNNAENKLQKAQTDSCDHLIAEELNALHKDPDYTELTLKKWIRHYKIFGDYTPFCWKGEYEIGDLPDGIDYEVMKTAIFAAWNDTSYVFGRHDSWEMVRWFAEKLHVAGPLSGPLGREWNIGHAVRYLFRLIERTRSLQIPEFSSTEESLTYISNNIQVTFRDIGRELHNFFKGIKKFYKSIENNPNINPAFKFVVRSIFFLLVHCHYLIIGFYSFQRIRNKMHNQVQALGYEQILEHSIATQISGPKQYLGSLINLNSMDERPGSFLAYEQIVAKIPNNYLRFKCKFRQIALPGKLNGEFWAMGFSPSEKTKNNKLAFYIPGTASSLRNTEIEETIATHLVNALEMPVILIAHRLAPGHKWPIPLLDVCQAIEHFYNEYNQPEVTVAGYSSGGLYAVLATLIISYKNIFVQRLILFAPLLDLSREFGCWTQEKHQQFTEYLPPSLSKDQGKLFKLKADAANDKFMSEGSFKEIIRNLFTENYYGNPKQLRSYSPAWFSIQMLSSIKKFPEVKIIIGEHDFFRIETQVFFSKLLAAKKSVKMLVLENENHSVIWQKLYPIYLSQVIPEQRAGQTSETAKKCLFELDVSLRQFCQQSKQIAQELVGEKDENVKASKKKEKEKLFNLSQSYFEKFKSEARDIIIADKFLFFRSAPIINHPVKNADYKEDSPVLRSVTFTG